MASLLYPAAKLLCISLGLWRSFKALKRRSPRAIKAYVIFWLIIMCYNTVEPLADTLISWVPFYTWAKLVFMLWFIIAQTSASNFLYQSFVRDFFASREDLIDEIVDKLRQSTVSLAADVNKQARVALDVAAEGYTLLKSVVLPLVNRLRPAHQEKTESTGALIDVGVSVNALSRARIQPVMSAAASNRARELQARSEDVLWPTARQTSPAFTPGIHPTLAAASSSSFASTTQQGFGVASESMRPPTRAYDDTLRYNAAPSYQFDPASKAQFNSTTDGRQPTTTTSHEWSSSSTQTVRAAYAPTVTIHAPTTYTYPHPHQLPAHHTSSSQNPKASSTLWNDSLPVASNDKNHTTQPILVPTTPWIPGGFMRPPQPAQARARSASSGLTDDDLDPEAERQRAERTEQIVRGLLADLGPILRSERREDGKAAQKVKTHSTDDDTPIVRGRASVPARPPINDDRSLTKPPLGPGAHASAVTDTTTTAAATAKGLKRPRPDAPDPLARAKGIKKSRIATADASVLWSTRHKLKPVAGAEVEREPRAVPVERDRRHDAKAVAVAMPARRRRALENTRGIEEETEKKGGKRAKDDMVDIYDAPREVVGKGKKRRAGSIDRAAGEEGVENGKGAVERKRQDRDKAREREEKRKSIQNGKRKRVAGNDDVAGKRELRNENEVDEEDEDEEEMERVEVAKSKGRGRGRESVGATKDMSRHVEMGAGIVASKVSA